MHYKQLDGLRGLAIFFVFIAHFLIPQVSDWFFFAWGSFGVRLFFVLSGFLITGILLKSRAFVDQGQSLSYTLKAFYFRRTLRIFFVYYAWLIVTAVFIGYQPRVVWDFLYLSNFYDIIYNNGAGNHYWSLAVEEQFYLLWPFFILLCPCKYMRVSLYGIVVSVFIARLYFGMAGVDYLILKKFPLFCVDALAMGGIVAHSLHASNLEDTKILRRYGPWVGVVAILIAMNDLWMHSVKGRVYTSFLHTGFALLASGLLAGAVKGYRGWFGALLGCRPLCFLGAISYGCYLYHLVVRSVIDSSGASLAGSCAIISFIDFAIKVGITIALASLSWFAFERPINSFKDWYPMDASKADVARLSVLSRVRGSFNAFRRIRDKL